MNELELKIDAEIRKKWDGAQAKLSGNIVDKLGSHLTKLVVDKYKANGWLVTTRNGMYQSGGKTYEFKEDPNFAQDTTQYNEEDVENEEGYMSKPFRFRTSKYVKLDR